ncbi:hypothetical protein EVAR_62596_1 [Eumeta japonica]|uniref:Uncharacterized protein n=1 Tax=Eumeta variegata TaxID=151549 RepID=A0A4C1ZR95_EUMVA|nr:hypothetical protein EVAR_62596_1 [Eumeta japonica]
MATPPPLPPGDILYIAPAELLKNVLRLPKNKAPEPHGISSAALSIREDLPEWLNKWRMAVNVGETTVYMPAANESCQPNYA